ncbi:aminotransferase class V-fold PLP-dependent enzyme [Sphingomonas cannabina]|uniref:aminotransferase class V-fold PLP-dependent enzyme n=1 Tax=Sphingomonas cannabina TaxID=2899123 RepID=UPI001F397D93|nr:aminotransferase class V-fold PLP-dependent enzyme [Sphingomonas cannabina]UIJ46356.1 aminotransferase class V-fold PLP-dependent enzyme [Sphingomonas cannabina]
MRPATPRGLSADQTLVLVNGKRYHRSALLGTRSAHAPDLASIPSLAIKRIEVLRDGASAQYGSDVIAGVINITPDQPAWTRSASFPSKEYQAGARGGIAPGDRGSIVLTGEYDKSEATSRTRQRPDAIAFQAANPTIAVLNPVQRWGQPDEERIRGAIDARYRLDDVATLYLFSTAQSADGVTDFNWRNPAGTANVYNSSSAFPGFSFRTLYPAGFTPRFGTEFSDYQADTGVRGELGERFRYDVSVGLGRSRIDYTMRESLNASLNAAAFEANPQLRLVLLTHLSHRTGLVLPVREIAALARARGIDAIVDAAHSWGAARHDARRSRLRFRRHQLPQWLGAPLGVGAIHIRRRALSRIDRDPAESANGRDGVQARVHTGTADFAAILTVPDALAFQQAIGRTRRAARLRALRDRWVSAVRPLPGIEILTPDEPDLHGGITAFRLCGLTSVGDNAALSARLLDRHRIFTVHRDGPAKGACVRVTPALFKYGCSGARARGRSGADFSRQCGAAIERSIHARAFQKASLAPMEM